MKSGRIDWVGAAEKLGSLIAPEALDESVRAWARRRPAGERWAVALSGGADSVCLLLLLLAHWPKRSRTLHVLHFNHRLRGRESLRDAFFCRAVCRSLGLSYSEGAWENPMPHGEAAARAARFAFFDREMARRKIRVLCLGHQRDDIAESLLMRIARGSGSAGLAAPRPLQSAPKGRIHVRPLLSLPRDFLRRSLRTAGASWREDSSNAGKAYFRNRIRKSVIAPWSRASGRDAAAGAALSRRLLEEDDMALENWTDSLKALTGKSLRLSPLKGIPRAVLRRVLRRWIAKQPKAGELSRQGFEALLGSLERGDPARHSLGRSGFAVIRGSLLRFERLNASRPVR